MENAANLAPDTIPVYAKTAGLDPAAFGSCFESAKYLDEIRAGVREGSSIGVQGTPSFVLGRSTREGVSGVLLVGAMPFTSFEAEVKKLESK